MTANPHGRNVGLGEPARCVNCGQVWPCSGVAVKQFRVVVTTKKGEPYEFGTYDTFEKAHQVREMYMTTMDEKYAEQIEVRIEERDVTPWVVSRD